MLSTATRDRLGKHAPTPRRELTRSRPTPPMEIISVSRVSTEGRNAMLTAFLEIFKKRKILSGQVSSQSKNYIIEI